LSKNNPFQAFQYSEFNYFIFSRFLVTISFAIQFIVIEWFVYQLTKNPLHLGLIALAEIIPAVGLSLISGHIIDKNEKRNAVLFSIISSFLLSLFFYFIFNSKNYFSTNTFLFLLYFLVFIVGIIRAFFAPSVFSLFSLILPKEVYANGTTWSSSAWQIGAILGPALAGILLSIFSEANAILFSSFFLLICCILISLIKKKPIIYKKSDSIKESISVGLKFVFGNKIILTAMSLDLFAVLFGGAIALLPIFITDEIIFIKSYKNELVFFAEIFNYHLNLEQLKSLAFGILRTAPAFGAIITMIFIAYIPIKNKTGVKLIIAVLFFGIFIICFGFSKHFWLSFLFLFLSGIADGFSVVIRSTILQLLTPDDMRGRVAAVNTIFVGSSNELGAFESGVTAKWFGTIRATVLGGIITCFVACSSYFISPKMKNFEMKD
jgi:MFS family permease